MKLSAAKKMTLGAMTAALSVLCLYAAAALPTGRIAAYFLSALFIYILSYEKLYFSAFVTFAATCGIALLILPSRLPAFAYIALLGHYGIFRSFIDSSMNDGFVRTLIRLIYCNVFIGVGLALAFFVFDTDIAAMLPDIAVWILIIIGEAAIFAFDLLYSFCIKLYLGGIRDRIIARR